MATRRNPVARALRSSHLQQQIRRNRKAYRRVDIKAILRDPKQRKELLDGVQQFFRDAKDIF